MHFDARWVLRFVFFSLRCCQAAVCVPCQAALHFVMHCWLNKWRSTGETTIVHAYSISVIHIIISIFHVHFFSSLSTLALLNAMTCLLVCTHLRCARCFAFDLRVRSSARQHQIGSRCVHCNNHDLRSDSTWTRIKRYNTTRNTIGSWGRQEIRAAFNAPTWPRRHRKQISRSSG